MKLCSRELDTRIVILQSVTVREAVFGTNSTSWEPLGGGTGEVWAKVRGVLPSRAETFEQGIDLAVQRCRVWLRWRSDVTAQMRLVIGGTRYRIISGPTMLGRRGGLELLAEALSSEGAEP